METLDAIATRRSIATLTTPGPTRQQLEQLLDAAVLAPNHHLTEPWRFVVLGGDSLDELGVAFAESARTAGTNVEAARRLPQLAPAIIAVIDRGGHDHHVSEADEHYAVGAAMQNLLLAAHDAGFGAMIRTGIHVRDPGVRHLLGVKPDETIAGLIYIGTIPPGFTPPPVRRTPASTRTEWRTDLPSEGQSLPPEPTTLETA